MHDTCASIGTNRVIAHLRGREEIEQFANRVESITVRCDRVDEIRDAQRGTDLQTARIDVHESQLRDPMDAEPIPSLLIQPLRFICNQDPASRRMSRECARNRCIIPVLINCNCTPFE